MFVGTYLVKLDSKSRVVIPSKFRVKIEERRVVIGKGIGEYLHICPANKFQEIFSSFQKALGSNVEEDSAIRIILAGSVEMELDAWGRIMIPHYLKEYASIIDQEVVILGQGDYMEMWSKERWDEYTSKEVSIDFEGLLSRKERRGSKQNNKLNRMKHRDGKEKAEDLLLERLKHSKDNEEREALIKLISEYALIKTKDNDKGG